MGRRAKNKQGDPLPLDADPDINGSLKISKLRTKAGLKGKSSIPNLKAKLGKRKSERDDKEERVAKKPKMVWPGGKSKPHPESALTKRPTAKTKSNGKNIDVEEEETTDNSDSVRWEDVDGVDMETKSGCVCFTENVNTLFIREPSTTGHHSVTVTQPTEKTKMKNLPDFLET